MQSTGQTSTHALSFVPMHGSQMIYATHVSRQNPLTAQSISRSLVAALAAAVSLSSGSAQSDAPWRDAPEYVALLAPAGHQDAYRAMVSPLAPDALLPILEIGLSLLKAPGAWAAHTAGAFEAFGKAGAYDRTTMARLYRGRQVKLVRGPRAVGGRVTESWSLISPYPNPAVTRLEPGTLILVLRLP